MNLFTIFLEISSLIDKNNKNGSFSEESLHTIYKLVDIYNANIVVTSTEGICLLNNDLRKKYIQCILKENTDLKIDNINVIDLFLESQNKEYSSKSLGIVDYIIKNNVKHYVIIDNEKINEYDSLNLNYYVVNETTGLRNNDYKKIIHNDYSIKPINNIKYDQKEYIKSLKIV